MRPPSDPNRTRALGFGSGLALTVALAAGCSDGGESKGKGQADASGTTWYGVNTDGGAPPTVQASMAAPAPESGRGATDGAK